MDAISEAGGAPFIALKNNAVPRQKGKGRKALNPAWEKMYNRISLRKGHFLRHHHKRTNFETTIGALRRISEALCGPGRRPRGSIGLS